MNRTGWAVAIGGLLLLGVGAAAATPELTIVGAAALAASATAALLTRRRMGIDVDRRIVPDRVMVGAPASLVLTVSNPSARPVPAVLAHQGDGRALRRFVIAPLAPGQSDEHVLALDTSRRGVYTIDQAELAHVDPLALAGASGHYGEPTQLIVHPRVHVLSPPSAISRQDVEGARSDRWSHGSEAFHALREYRSGDDHRLIHWKSSARTGELVVKQFVDLWKPEVLVILDTRQDVFTGERFEDAVECAASIVTAAVGQRHAATVALGSGATSSVQPGRGHERELLDLLASAEPKEGSSLVELARRAHVGQRSRVLVLVTGAPAKAELLAFLGATSAFQRRLVVRVCPGLTESPVVEVSRRGDEAISADNVSDFVAGWSRLVG